MNAKKIFGILLALIWLCLYLGPAYGAEQIDLKFNPEKGRSYDCHITTESSIVQTLGNQDIKVKQQLTMAIRCKVIEVASDGTADIRLTFTGMRFQQESPAGNIGYDSADPPEVIPPAAVGFAALVDAELLIRLSAKGEVLEVRGVDALLDKMFQELGSGDESIEIIKNSLKNQCGDQAIKEMTQKTAVAFPPHPMAVGDSWTSRVTFAKGYAMIVESTYRFRDYRDGVAFLDETALITPNSAAEPIDFGLFKMRYLLSGTQEGAIQIQTASGLPCYGRIGQHLSGLLEFCTAKSAITLNWPLKIESVITFETKEADSAE